MPLKPLRTLVVLADTNGAILAGAVGPEAINGEGAVDNH